MTATIDRRLIDREAMARVRDHAEQDYPNECCGLLVRLADGSTRVVKVRNVQDEMHAKDPDRYPRTARTAYAGHPSDLRAGLELADEPGCALVAFYHSHPDHDAYFSAEDTAQATPFGEPSYPDALQVVVSVRSGRAATVKAFAWSPADESYVDTPFEEA